MAIEGAPPPGPYSMQAFIDKTLDPDLAKTISHWSGTPTVQTAPSIESHYASEQFRLAWMPHDPDRTGRNFVHARVLHPQAQLTLRTGPVTRDVFSARNIKASTLPPGFLDEITRECDRDPTTNPVQVSELNEKVVVKRSLSAAETAFLGMPAGNYHVGDSMITSGDGTKTAIGPLLYHLMGTKDLRVHDIQFPSNTYGPSFKPNLKLLLEKIGTKDEATLLSTIRLNCLDPMLTTENHQAGIMVRLAMAYTWRTGCSSEIADVIQALANEEARDYASENRILPDRDNFWMRYWINLERKLEPDAMDVEFADVHTRRAETVLLEGDWGGPPIGARVKDIKYGNAAALEEVAALKMYSLTGLGAPFAVIAQRAQALFGGFDEATRRDFAQHQNRQDRFCVIVSPLLEGFKDLGMLLQDAKSMHELIDPGHKDLYDAILANYNRATDTYLALQKDEPIDEDGHHSQLAEIRAARGAQLGALQAMFRLLPQDMRDETAKAYFASKWVGNWDFLNVGMANFGFYKERGTGKWVAATVDFGNSLTRGFGGRAKQNSWETEGKKKGLNDPALPDDPDPYPRTKVPNVIDQRWTGDLGFRGMWPPEEEEKKDTQSPQAEGSAGPSSKGKGKETEQVKVKTQSFSGIGDLPRAIPIATVIENQIRAETYEVGCGGIDERQRGYNETALSPFLEAAYRLSLIPVSAIEAIAARYWPWQGAETEYLQKTFCPRGEDDEKLSHADLAHRMVQRRDELIGQLAEMAGTLDFIGWARRHPHEAKRAYAEVFAAVLGLTGVVIPPAPLQFCDDSGLEPLDKPIAKLHLDKLGVAEVPTADPVEIYRIDDDVPTEDLVEIYGIEDPEPKSNPDELGAWHHTYFRSGPDIMRHREKQRMDARVAGLAARQTKLAEFQVELTDRRAALAAQLPTIEAQLQQIDANRVEANYDEEDKSLQASVARNLKNKQNREEAILISRRDTLTDEIASLDRKLGEVPKTANLVANQHTQAVAEAAALMDEDA